VIDKLVITKVRNYYNMPYICPELITQTKTNTMPISELYQLYIHHSKISTDYQSCPIGSLYFALHSNTFDGNEYAKQALSSGAAYAIIDNPDYFSGERTILVDDTLKALQQLAHHHRRIVNIPVIAITGTKGKTTTTGVVAAVLASKFNLLQTENNQSDSIGVPLTLLRLNHEHEMAVIELKACSSGSIAGLATITMPNFGIITNTINNAADDKANKVQSLNIYGELYDYLRKTKGSIFIRKENKDLQSIAKGLEQITYGEDDTAFASGRVESETPSLIFNWKQQGKLHTVETDLKGSYNLENLLAAVAVGRHFKIPAERISRIVAAYGSTNESD